jgi:hypothetical protein
MFEFASVAVATQSHWSKSVNRDGLRHYAAGFHLGLIDRFSAAIFCQTLPIGVIFGRGIDL